MYVDFCAQLHLYSVPLGTINEYFILILPKGTLVLSRPRTGLPKKVSHSESWQCRWRLNINMLCFWVTGAYESMKWKSILYNLYDLLVNEISHIGSRGKYSSGSRNIAVKENLIDLMADICYQVQQLLSRWKFPVNLLSAGCLYFAL